MGLFYSIGIDLGGTFIKAGLISPDNHIIKKASIDTQAALGPAHVLNRIARFVNDLIAEAKIAKADAWGVGIGAPGPISHARGIIHAAPNLAGWVNVPVRSRLSEEIGLPVVLENDANAAAFGEYAAGAGKGVRSMVLLTLGTGVGGGIVIDGRLWRGDFDNAGEIGHMIIIPGGRACPCGQRGCLERYCSATALAERVIEAVHAGEGSLLATKIRATESASASMDGEGRLPIDAEDVAQAARDADSVAMRIWDDACRYLALACVSVMHIVNPERIVLGGGVINAGEQLLQPVRAHFDALRWKIAPDAPSIELASLGTDAGIVGAGVLARAQFAR